MKADLKPAWPLVPGPWKALDESESVAFVQRLDRHLRARGVSSLPLHRLRQVRAVPLSFYPGWLLVQGDGELAEGCRATLDVLLGPGFIWCLDGRTEILHQLHAGLVEHPAGAGDGDMPVHMPSPLSLKDEGRAVHDYLTFFCNQTRGGGGVTFVVIESLEDLRAVGIDGDHTPWAGRIAPLAITPWGAEPEGVASGAATSPARAGDSTPPDFEARGTMLFGQSLFTVRLSLRRNGNVVMLDDEPIVKDLAFPFAALEGMPWLRAVRRLAPDTA